MPKTSDAPITIAIIIQPFEFTKKQRIAGLKNEKQAVSKVRQLLFFRVIFCYLKVMGGKVVFKEYDPDQLTFLPYKLEELVPAGHPVRIVKQVVDQVDVKPLNRK